MVKIQTCKDFRKIKLNSIVFVVEKRNGKIINRDAYVFCGPTNDKQAFVFKSFNDKDDDKMFIWRVEMFLNGGLRDTDDTLYYFAKMTQKDEPSLIADILSAN